MVGQVMLLLLLCMGTHILAPGLATVTYEQRWVPMFMWYIRYGWVRV